MTFFSCALVGTNSVGDVFHSGFSVDSGSIGEASAQAIADKIATVFNANYQTVVQGATFGNLFPPSLVWEKAVVYERPMTAIGAATEVAETTLGPKPGTGIATSLPPEVALVISLLTGQPGRRARGRMYLPAMNTSSNAITPTGEVSDTAQKCISAWGGAFFGGINVLPTGGAGQRCVVWSRKNVATKNITQVAVGSQFDSQRRRQNVRPETYISTNVSQV